MHHANRHAKTFKVFSILLTYPKEEWVIESTNLLSTLQQEGYLGSAQLLELQYFIAAINHVPLLENQAYYVALFDQTPSLSLYLFEHIHGDSRDRGQAMVDLLNLYHENCLDIATNELPDYLPLFLEFLSTIDVEEALALLKDGIHVVEALAKRLAANKSHYTAILNSILVLADKMPIAWEVEKELKSPAIDFAEIDKLWEEGADHLHNDSQMHQYKPHEVGKSEYSFPIENLTIRK